MQGYNPAHFIEFYEEMTEFIQNRDVFHLRLPIQSASPHILKLMQRQYTRDDIDKVFGFLNEVGFRDFATDMIVGFPGESDEDYEESLQFLIRHHPQYVLLSSYMDASELLSYKLPGKIDQETKIKRLWDADRRLSANNIISNTDGGSITIDRQRRINVIDKTI